MALLALLVALSPVIAVPAPTPNLEGAWQGTLKLGALQLRIVFKLKRAGAAWTATLDSPDQAAQDVPVDEVKLDGQKLTLSMTKLRAKYEGTLTADTIAGTWTQGAASLPLAVTRTEHPASAGPRPQEPKPPLPYDAVEVTVPGLKGGLKLAGTLTLPRGKGPFPAAVLITGSGPQDRDEQMLGHKPFLVLADALTRRGIAVLRADDRGVGKSTGDFHRATTYDFVDDVLAEVAFLRARPEIDKGRVGLIGHSEGAVIAPMAAARSKDVAFIVLLAGTGVDGAKILEMQGAKIAKLEGDSDVDITRDAERRRKIFALLETEKDDAVIARKLRELWLAQPEAERRKPEHSEAHLAMQTKIMLSPWFRAFLTLDPRTYLKQVKVPVLALNGERDAQVPPKENLPEIAAALQGNPDVTVRELPELNHLFQHCKTGAPAEYGQIDETFSPGALALIGDWVIKHTR